MKTFAAALVLALAGAGGACGSSPLAAEDSEKVEPADEAEIGSDFDWSPEGEAMAEFEREMTESFAIFSEVFKVEPLTPEQEARLPLAGEMAIRIMPEGTFAEVMDDMMAPMMNAVMGVITADPRIRLAQVSGVTPEDLTGLDDAAAQEALDIFDPAFTMRTERMTDITMDMMSKLFGALEPSYREAYARAIATRFEEAEMRELLAFFETPVGGKFARESLRVQYDPQMMVVMEQMGPAMVEVMPSLIEGIAGLEAEFASERRYGELSAAERARAARLIGKAEAELDALQPSEAEAGAHEIEGAGLS
ncbi:MAG: DUF2059 domain-containing protein [Erythrobacter sp.]|jgi:hypothetical protein|nr:DUF2059 domain-containing protein [Erythrobacter sp.]